MIVMLDIPEAQLSRLHYVLHSERATLYFLAPAIAQIRMYTVQCSEHSKNETSSDLPFLANRIL